MKPERKDAAPGGDTPQDLTACADALRAVMQASERLRLVTARHLGLSITDNLAVSYLLAEGPMGQTDLAESLSMTTGSVTSLLDRLADRDFIERMPHPTDRRRTIVQLTEDGTRRIMQANGWTVEAFQTIDLVDYVATAETLRAVAIGLRRSGDTILARADAADFPSSLR